MSVKTILSFFRFVLFLLERAEKRNNDNVEFINETMTALIVKREQHTSEAAKAKRAQKKLKELLE